MAKAKKIEAVTEVSENDVIEALQNFVTTSADAIGVSRTVEVLTFFTDTISKNPETYRKITKPENVDKLNNVMNQYSNKTPSMIDAFSIMGQLKEIFA